MFYKDCIKCTNIFINCQKRKPKMKQAIFTTIFILFILNEGYAKIHTEISKETILQKSLNDIPIICQGDAFTVMVYGIPTNSKIDSIHYIGSDLTLKFTLPTFFSKEDTLLIFVKSDTLQMTGDITIHAYVRGVSEVKISQIRIVPNPKITIHPLDYYACQGDQVRFSVNGSNYDNIRWEFLSPHSLNWNYYANENNSDLFISANKSINDKNQFRAVLSNENTCFAYSLPAILTLDSTRPEVNCPPDTEIIIDDDSSSYLFAIRPRPLSIFDECGVNESTTRRSDNKQATDPYPLGTTAVTFIVTDKSGNIGQCSFNVSIKNYGLDTLPPVARCKDTILYLDSYGKAYLIPDDLDNGSTGFKSSENLWLSKATFTCNDLGLNEVVLFVENKIGYIDSCVSIVNVRDTTTFNFSTPPKNYMLNACLHDPNSSIIRLTSLPISLAVVEISVQQFIDAYHEVIGVCSVREISYIDSFESDGCPLIISRTFKIQKNDGQIFSFTQTFNLSDNSEPKVSCPPDMFLKTGETIPPTFKEIGQFLEAGGKIIDNCPDDDFSIYIISEYLGTIGLRTTLQRAYYVEDICRNSAVCLHRIHIDDTETNIVNPPESTNFSVRIYPNPNRGVFDYELHLKQSTQVRIEVVDVTGRVYYSTTKSLLSGLNNEKIHLATLAKGVYFLKVSDGTSMATERFAVEK
jgi:hypothetical protein